MRFAKRRMRGLLDVVAPGPVANGPEPLGEHHVKQVADDPFDTE